MRHWNVISLMLCAAIRNPEFSRRFFDIWLGDETSLPELRTQLLDETTS